MEIKKDKIVFEIYSGEIIQSKFRDVKVDDDGLTLFKLGGINDIGISADWIPESYIGEHIFETYDEAKAVLGLTDREKLHELEYKIQSGKLVEVVRCCECKSLEKNACRLKRKVAVGTKWFDYCHEHREFMVPDVDFCSAGERVD